MSRHCYLRWKNSKMSSARNGKTFTKNTFEKIPTIDPQTISSTYYFQYKYSSKHRTLHIHQSFKFLIQAKSNSETKTKKGFENGRVNVQDFNGKHLTKAYLTQNSPIDYSTHPGTRPENQRVAIN